MIRIGGDRRLVRRYLLSTVVYSQQLGQLAIQLAFTAVLSVGVLLAGGGSADPARIIALLVLGIHFLRPFEVVAGAAGSLRVCQAALARVDALLAAPPLPAPVEPVTLGEPSSELSGVSFGYGDRPVLTEVDLVVPAGTTTALVGPSGAGKTTVTKLIARFFDPDSGTIRLGGTDIREIAVENAISVVFQDIYLFDGTIEHNIRIGRPEATAAEVAEAARRARVDLDLATRVGDGGTLLSGGQRQRVAIARALLKDAPIVLLDEASALDAENEAAIHEALAELGKDRTLLIIAHRLDTIAAADQIAVLDGGRIVEHGRHAELLAAGGRYAALWAERERARGWRLLPR